MKKWGVKEQVQNTDKAVTRKNKGIQAMLCKVNKGLEMNNNYLAMNFSVKKDLTSNNAISLLAQETDQKCVFICTDVYMAFPTAEVLFLLETKIAV